MFQFLGCYIKIEEYDVLCYLVAYKEFTNSQDGANNAIGYAFWQCFCQFRLFMGTVAL